ncbi:hypothetical protein [Pseudonocardia broussonetiae]|uniref:Uncharacterized protein n=1 Tax=Pseudonocardia broussonetiae TaxID=2736640 RepID=A0A6M6JMW4_9PSEU|nr:hypothetical protein [Pseudonocardia broussonetiae]QJY47769.1 hypothetical protein HOP40_19745 [Pseudonocardia broussonetiae]
MPSKPDPADHLAARVAASEQRSRQLTRQVSRVAGEIAETERRVATTLEQIADDEPDRAETLLAKAREAREFAEHELAEQERWDSWRSGRSATTTPRPSEAK